MDIDDQINRAAREFTALELIRQIFEDAHGGFKAPDSIRGSCRQLRYLTGVDIQPEIEPILEERRVQKQARFTR